MAGGETKRRDDVTKSALGPVHTETSMSTNPSA